MRKEGNSRPVDCVEGLWLGVDSGRVFRSSFFHVENIETGKGIDRGFVSTLAMPAKMYKNYYYKIEGDVLNRGRMKR